ncbi:hypothetical protein ACS0TY_000006 [Phlomoides rotata]
MENSEVQNVVKELCEGRELTKQLQAHLLLHSSSSNQNLEFLLHRILYSYDHALSILSPPPPPGSPQTEDSDQDQLASRKRWSEKIKVGAEAGIEGQLDDGYGWRKYGQKDILGAKYPRGYYRCTYRHAQGCLATKQVQRSDNDPTTFEITYRRNHTCNPRANEDPINPELNEPLFNIQTSLRVTTNQSPRIINPENNHTFSYGLENYKPISTDDEELIPNLQNSPTLGPFVSSGFGSNFSFGNPGFFP